MAETPNNDAQQETVGDIEKLNTDSDENMGSSDVKVNVSVDVIELPHGKALTLPETYRITSSQKVKFVVLAGPSGSGKTTLVTTIYHMLQKNPLAGYWFAGSETLLGFEQRAYLARTHSQNASPQVAKTRRGISDAILHLRLCDSKCHVSQDLLISDFSGEDYKSVVGNVDLAKSEFGIIKRADHIVLLIDGDLISQKRYRNGVELESMQLLKTMYDAELIRDDVSVDIVISKYDIVLQKSKDDPSISIFISNLKTKFNDKFNGKSINLRYSEIAAMPENTAELKLGFGLKELLSYWVESSCEPIDMFHNDIHYKSISEFNLFSNRTQEVKL